MTIYIYMPAKIFSLQYNGICAENMSLYIWLNFSRSERLCRRGDCIYTNILSKLNIFVYIYSLRTAPKWEAHNTFV